jgi:hypothetical protein
MLQDDYIVTGHVDTKVVMGAVCLVMLSVHKKTAANCVDCSVFSCHSNSKPSLVKQLQVSALLSIVAFVGFEIYYHSILYFQTH